MVCKPPEICLWAAQGGLRPPSPLYLQGLPQHLLHTRKVRSQNAALAKKLLQLKIYVLCIFHSEPLHV